MKTTEENTLNAIVELGWDRKVISDVLVVTKG